MTISLTYPQRINLGALIGFQKGTVGEIRVFWSILDKLELSEEEKRKINFRLVPNGDGEIPMWENSDETVERTLTSEELAKIKTVLTEFPNFRPRDRIWLEPLLALIEDYINNATDSKTKSPT